MTQSCSCKTTIDMIKKYRKKRQESYNPAMCLRACLGRLALAETDIVSMPRNKTTKGQQGPRPGMNGRGGGIERTWRRARRSRRSWPTILFLKGTRETHCVAYASWCRICRHARVKMIKSPAWSSWLDINRWVTGLAGSGWVRVRHQSWLDSMVCW